MILGFAGAGNMAEALARGWADAEHAPDAMLFCDNGSGRARKLAERTGGEAVTTLKELALRSDAVLLAVKPNALEIVAEKLDGEARAIASVLGATSVRAPARAVSRRPGPADDADGRHRDRRGRDLPRAADARRGRGRRPAAQPLRPARPHGRDPRRPDGPGHGGDGLLARLPRDRRPEPCRSGRRGGSRPRAGVRARDRDLRRDRSSCCATTTRSRFAAPSRRRGGSTEAGLEALADAGAADAFRAAVRASLARMRG